MEFGHFSQRLGIMLFISETFERVLQKVLVGMVRVSCGSPILRDPSLGNDSSEDTSKLTEILPNSLLATHRYEPGALGFKFDTFHAMVAFPAPIQL